MKKKISFDCQLPKLSCWNVSCPKRIRQNHEQFIVLQKAVGNHCLLVPDTRRVCPVSRGAQGLWICQYWHKKLAVCRAMSPTHSFVGLNGAWKCNMLSINISCSNSQARSSFNAKNKPATTVSIRVPWKSPYAPLYSHFSLERGGGSLKEVVQPQKAELPNPSGILGQKWDWVCCLCHVWVFDTLGGCEDSDYNRRWKVCLPKTLGAWNTVFLTIHHLFPDPQRSTGKVYPAQFQTQTRNCEPLGRQKRQLAAEGWPTLGAHGCS